VSQQWAAAVTLMNAGGDESSTAVLVIRQWIENDTQLVEIGARRRQQWSDGSDAGYGLESYVR
jgi:hypothetical protein